AAGLSREAALDALTRRPAEIAGLGRRLGTIEPGKLGHLVVMTGPLGEETARVRYVFVDGLKFEVDREKDKEKDVPAKKGNGEAKAAPAKPEAKAAAPKAEAKGDAKAEAAKARVEEPKARECPKAAAPPPTADAAGAGP